MFCPNCGAEEQVRVRYCHACGSAFSSADLLKLRQLEFMLKETADWPGVEELRKPYTETVSELRRRVLRTPLPSKAIEPPTPQAQIPPAAGEPATTAEPVVTLAQPTKSVPFDQWLLSERNIKIALYSGGLLLVLAGLIFVGINWGRIPGPAKFAITLMITGLLYLGGYLLFQRPTLRLGGVALLAVSSGFIPLNFVVLQLYIFGPQGLDNNVMWFASSFPILLLYVLTACWTRADLFTVLSMAGIVSAVTAALVLFSASLSLFALVYSLLAFVFLLGARTLAPSRWGSFTRLPLLIVSQIAAPILFLVDASLWIASEGAAYNGPWLALGAMIVIVGYYLATDRLHGWLAARWAWAFTFILTAIFVLAQLQFSDLATGLSLKLLAVLYLGVGYRLEEQTKRPTHRVAGLPLYSAGYAAAAFVTLQTLTGVVARPDYLAVALVADVILLAVSARIHRRYEWVYGATWLFILPVFIASAVHLPGNTSTGLVLGLLLLNYVAAGYLLGRRALRLGGPFLTAAAFLSIAVVALTWMQPTVATFSCGVIAVLYLFVALWLGWPWLLLPALAAVNLAVLSTTMIFIKSDPVGERVLTIVYALLGIALTLGAAALRRGIHRGWAWPLYLVALVDLGLSFLAALALDATLAASLSALLAFLAIWLAWLERDAFIELKSPPLLTYTGAALVFIAQLNVLRALGLATEIWPVFASILYALYIVISWGLRGAQFQDVFGTPAHRSGLALMVLPLFASVVLLQPAPAAVTFSIAGVALAADGGVRRVLNLMYLAGGAFVAVIWALLIFFKVSELQAYVIPLGIGLLLLGWNERQQRRCRVYIIATRLGLVLLMGSAFWQSLSASSYAVLLLMESLAAVAWGLHTRSRGYVELAILSLIFNAVPQLGPAFAALDRWIQIGAIGSLLLGGGLVALFQRDRILSARQSAANQWREWQV